MSTPAAATATATVTVTVTVTARVTATATLASLHGAWRLARSLARSHEARMLSPTRARVLDSGTGARQKQVAAKASKAADMSRQPGP
eukprot:2355536-Rhodomonas_salina.1